MPRKVSALVEDISQALDIPAEEAELYVNTVIEGRCKPEGEEGREAAKSLAARGMLILDADGRGYLPVHPRMAMSNLFRAYEERLVRQRKEKRLLVDRLTLELIPLMGGEGHKSKRSEGSGI